MGELVLHPMKEIRVVVSGEHRRGLGLIPFRSGSVPVRHSERSADYGRVDAASDERNPSDRFG